MKLSVTPYTFHQEFYRGEMDVFHLIETIKCRYHLNAVDMWNPQLESITDEAYLKRVKAALDANDLIVNNYAMDGANLWDPVQRSVKEMWNFTGRTPRLRKSWVLSR